jgi:hypothetical protein
MRMTDRVEDGSRGGIAGFGGGRDIVPIHPEPIARGGLTCLPSGEPTHLAFEAFDAEGYRPGPGLHAILVVRGIVVCVRSEAAQEETLPGGLPLPARC